MKYALILFTIQLGIQDTSIKYLWSVEFRITDLVVREVEKVGDRCTRLRIITNDSTGNRFITNVGVSLHGHAAEHATSI